MSDDKVRLWRYGEVYFDLREPPPDVEHHAYIARPVADDDALLRALMKSSLDAGAWKATADAATRDRDERDAMLRAAQARAERAEALLHDVEAALDNAGVARSTAPTVDACTDRDTPDRYPRLAQADRVKVLAKSEKDILDRLLDADTATRKAEAERDSARAELAEQRKLWEQIPGGPDYDADENDLSPDDAASHLAGIAIRRIDAETRGAGE